jgi:hypothetical protein
MRNKISDEYRRRVNRLELGFPAAYGFVQRLEREGHSHGLWLSSASNAHLYKGNAYLAYLLFEPSETSPPSLELRAEFNHHIHAGAEDRSSLVFPGLIDDLVRQSDGGNDRWIRKLAGGSRELNSHAPKQFFDLLFGRLCSLDVNAGRAVN